VDGDDADDDRREDGGLPFATTPDPGGNQVGMTGSHYPPQAKESEDRDQRSFECLIEEAEAEPRKSMAHLKDHPAGCQNSRHQEEQRNAPAA
jgi:hypothetical protein